MRNMQTRKNKSSKKMRRQSLSLPPRKHRFRRRRRCLRACTSTVCGLDHGASGSSTKGTVLHPPGRRGSQ